MSFLSPIYQPGQQPENNKVVIKVPEKSEPGTPPEVVIETSADNDNKIFKGKSKKKNKGGQ
jgi:hypothetical protein